jgi:hypothetical protein
MAGADIAEPRSFVETAADAPIPAVSSLPAAPCEQRGAAPFGDRLKAGLPTPDRLKAGLQPSATTAAQHAAAEARAQVCEAFLRLTSAGHTGNVAARLLRKSPSWFSGENSPLARYRREGLAGLLPRPRVTAKIHFPVPDWFVPAAQFFYLKTNLTWASGSVPEAVRRTISLPVCPPALVAPLKKVLAPFGPSLPACPPELREKILTRQRAGQTLVPPRLAKLIRASAVVVRHARHAKNTDLDHFNSPGYSKFLRDGAGAYEPLRCGQAIQPDDGSVNFCVCIPWPWPTTACSRKFGVLVDRFQLLLAVDTLSLFIGARSYVVRPRSSYRQEDVLTLYNIFMRQHGIPLELRHEGGVWNAKRVLDCLAKLGVRAQRLHSPHTKAAVEGRFNKLWTVLSGLTDGQIGRYRAEMDAENKLLTAAKEGRADPRKHFPLVGEALAAIDQAIEETNATTVQTDAGRWEPLDLWTEQLAATPLRRLDAQSEWMFRPYCRRWKVRQAIVGGDVPLFEDFSVPFRFAAAFLVEYLGATVDVYFNPHEANRCRGMIVLAEDFHGKKAGALLGEAHQVHGTAEYARLVLGCGTGPSDLGRQLRQQTAAAVRRDTRAITGGAAAERRVEERDGIARSFSWSQEDDATATTHARDGQRRMRAELPAQTFSAPPQSRAAADDPTLQEFLDD